MSHSVAKTTNHWLSGIAPGGRGASLHMGMHSFGLQNCPAGMFSDTVANVNASQCESREHGPNQHLAKKIWVLQTCTAFWPQTVTRVTKWAEIFEMDWQRAKRWLGVDEQS